MGGGHYKREDVMAMVVLRGVGARGKEGARLVGDALRELPAVRSRDTNPRPIIDRSREERRSAKREAACRFAIFPIFAISFPVSDISFVEEREVATTGPPLAPSPHLVEARGTGSTIWYT